MNLVRTVCMFAFAALGGTALAQLTPSAPATEPVHAAAPGLAALAPLERSTSRESVHILGRTTPGTAVWVAGMPAQVFSSGVFVRDQVPVALGGNTLTIEWQSGGGSRHSLQLQIERVPPPAPVQWPTDALFLDGSSLRPQHTVRVAPGEGVEVAVRATRGRQAWARLPGEARWQPLHESSPGRYRARLTFSRSDDVEPGPVQIVVQNLGTPSPNTPSQRPPSKSSHRQGLWTSTLGAAGQWRIDAERLVRVGPDGAELLHGLHEVRLGGPFLGEMSPGVLLNTNGQQGEHLRVQLNADTTAWVPQNAVSPAAPGTPAPITSFTSMALSGNAQGGDTLRVAVPAAMPVAVRAVADAQGQHSLELDVFGAHHATTWITHRANATLVREVTAVQAAPGRVLIRLALSNPRLWGWRLERGEQSLQLHVLPPPQLAAADSSQPLAGLRVALEPGHGGPTNLGAVGATGVPEKDINRWTVQALQAELLAAGAEVIIVRENDDNPTLRERASRAMESRAHIYLSVHANASDTSGGYLRVSGTSTYYKHAPGRNLAAAIQRQMLVDTGLQDFGLVGNFNYTPLRLVTTMPAALVELAFMSHPGDEAKLLEPEFRGVMARAIRQGLQTYLRQP